MAAVALLRAVRSTAPPRVRRESLRRAPRTTRRCCRPNRDCELELINAAPACRGRRVRGHRRVRDRRRRRHRHRRGARPPPARTIRGGRRSHRPPRSSTLPIRTFADGGSFGERGRTLQLEQLGGGAKRVPRLDGRRRRQRGAARGEGGLHLAALLLGALRPRMASTSSRLSSISRRIAYPAQRLVDAIMLRAAPRRGRRRRWRRAAGRRRRWRRRRRRGRRRSCARRRAAASSRRSVSAGASPCATGPARSDADSARSTAVPRWSEAGARIGVGATPERRHSACSCDVELEQREPLPRRRCRIHTKAALLRLASRRQCSF